MPETILNGGLISFIVCPFVHGGHETDLNGWEPKPTIRAVWLLFVTNQIHKPCNYGYDKEYVLYWMINSKQIYSKHNINTHTSNNFVFETYLHMQYLYILLFRKFFNIYLYPLLIWNTKYSIQNKTKQKWNHDNDLYFNSSQWIVYSLWRKWVYCVSQLKYILRHILNLLNGAEHCTKSLTCPLPNTK